MNYLMRHLIRAAAVSATVCLTLATIDHFSGIPSRAETSRINLRAERDRNTLDAVSAKFNGKLVFSSDRHNGRGLSIWTMNADGSNPTRLTDEKSRTDRLPSFVPVYDLGPVWSPDGARIAFTSNRDYLFGVYIMSADGSNVRLVTDKVQNSASIAWAPDGNRIALSGGVRTVPAIEGGPKPSVNIYTVNTDGSQLTKLTSEGINDSPTWSPDGKQIAFNSNRDPDGSSKIWVMNADGGNQHRLTDIHGTSNPIFYDDGGPVWSPDGTKILFGGYRDFNGTRNCAVVNCAELFVMNADGSNDVPLTNDPTRDGGFAARWSPDGTRIVASRSLGTIADRGNGISMPTAIFVMNADGTNPVKVSNRSERFYIDAPVDWQPLSAPPVSLPSLLGIGAALYSAYEDSGSITVTVKRTGNLNDAASCSYATQDGTAMVKSDYGPVFGRLQFAPGEASKNISIPLTDSASVRGNRSFKLTLSDNEGNATFIGGIRETTVTVLDRDSSPRPKSPIDDTAYFVRQHYVDFLNREPDPEGLAFWIDQIESCGSDLQCREVKRINVSAAFYLSIEFQETGFFAFRFNLLNPYNVNDTGFLTIVREMQEIGDGVVVGRDGWRQQLDANKLAFVQRYYEDNRLALSFGRTDAEYVDLLFQYVNFYSGVTLPPVKRDALVTGLENGVETRPQVFIEVADDEQFKAALFNQVFVLMEYYGYLRRDPDAPGYSFWLEKLNKFQGNYIDAEMVKAFLSSIEYRGRFG
jgi:Tol biopolymer transport system component